jgi:hypothetical protein
MFGSLTEEQEKILTGSFFRRWSGLRRSSPGFADSAPSQDKRWAVQKNREKRFQGI